jgi:hypothetical protein
MRKTGGNAGKWSLAGAKSKKAKAATTKTTKKKMEAMSDFAGFDQDEAPKGDLYSHLRWKTVKIDDALRGEAGLVAFEELDAADVAHLLPPSSGKSAVPAPAAAGKTNKRKRGSKDTTVTVRPPPTIQQPSPPPRALIQICKFL